MRRFSSGARHLWQSSLPRIATSPTGIWLAWDSQRKSKAAEARKAKISICKATWKLPSRAQMGTWQQPTAVQALTLPCHGCMVCLETHLQSLGVLSYAAIPAPQWMVADSFLSRARRKSDVCPTCSSHDSFRSPQPALIESA